MRCDQARIELDAARYGAVDGPELAAARTHLEGCADCQAYARASESLDASLPVAEDDAPGPGFDTRFFARLEAEKQTERRRFIFGLGALIPVGLGAAAAVAFVLRPAVSELGTELDLALELELIEDVDLLRQLDDVDDMDVVADVRADELERLIEEDGG